MNDSDHDRPFRFGSTMNTAGLADDEQPPLANRLAAKKSWLWNACWAGVILAYVIAVFGVALLMSGDTGLIAATDVVVSWGLIFRSRRPFSTAAVILGLHLAIIALFALLVPSVSHPRGMSDYSSCRHNMRSIAIAIDGYLDAHGTFPPAFLADENGTPRHSWRVLILPHLGHKDVYDRYRFDEPWNGPNNSLLAAEVEIKEYVCRGNAKRGSTKSAATTYMAVVGDGTCWPGATPRIPVEITDGLSNVIVLIEAEPIKNWMEPKDLTFDEAVVFLASDRSAHRVPSNTIFRDTSRPMPRLAAMCDGAIKSLATRIPTKLSERLLHVSDGAPINIDAVPPRHDYDHDRTDVLLKLFIALVFLPVLLGLVHAKLADAEKK